MASWRRLPPAENLTIPKFAGIVLLFSAVAVIVQLSLWLANATDYVGIDPDDAMRLVEVRDLLAGQSWFDLTQYRLGPDGGTLMHWSRLVDWPIAGLIRFYGFFLGPQQAEAAALATWPLLLILPLLAFTALAAYRLNGRSGVVIALILALAFLAAIVRFRPGAIDHHNVQLVLATSIAAMLVDPMARARNFAAAAAAGAAGLAIGVETTPLVAVAAIVVALLWVMHGERYRRAAVAFGLTFAAVSAGIFLATTPPRLWSNVTCDTLSLGYFALAATGGAMLAASALFVTGKGLAARLGASALAGIVVIAVALAVAPQCLHSPLEDLDPLLKTYWLSTIGEAQSIASELAASPQNIGAFYAVGVIAVAVCLMRILRREQMTAHSILLGLVAVSWAVSAFQVRGMLFANFLAFIPLSALIADLRGLYLERRNDLRAATAFALSALLSVPSVWSMVGILAFDPINALARTPESNAQQAESKPGACVTRDSIAGLAALPPGRILASFNEGPSILRFTPHSVLGANYHRNQRGMVATIKIGMANPDNAREQLESEKVGYILLCRGDHMAERIAGEYPAGLFAALMNDDIPGYLEELSAGKSTGFRIYQMIQR